MSGLPSCLLSDRSAAMVADRLVREIERESARDAELSARWQAFIKLQAPWEKNFEASLVKSFGEMEAEVLRNMRRSPKAAARRKDAINTWLFSYEKWRDLQIERGTPFIVGIAKQNGDRAMEEVLGAGVAFNVDDPGVARKLRNRTRKFAAEVTETTRRSIRRTLAAGIDAGETMPELSARVSQVFEAATASRARMIARTETIWASHEGAQSAWEQSGVVESKAWLIADDERLCDFCAEMDQRYGPDAGGIPLADNFANKGDEISGGAAGNLTVEYEAIQYPPLHPNCRCDIIPIIKEA